MQANFEILETSGHGRTEMESFRDSIGFDSLQSG